MDEKKQKQIEQMDCEKCLHYFACLVNSEYVPTPCVAYEDKAGYRKQSESEWISVDERLPDIELHKAKAVAPDVLFPCLVVREGNIVSYIEKAWYWGAKFTTQDCTDITDSITHWMPLPEAPKMKGGAE